MRFISDTPLAPNAIARVYWDLSIATDVSNNTQTTGSFQTSLTYEGAFAGRSVGCNPHYTNWGAYGPSEGLFICHHGGVHDFGGIYNNGVARAGTMWIR